MKTLQNSYQLAQAASNNAQQFLISSRQSNGLWIDFKTLAGASNEWVSGYVGNILAKHGNKKSYEVASDVCEKLLKKRFWLSGWSYNHFVPPDADSTVWVTLLAQNLSIKNRLRITRAKIFLDKHVDENGGVRTYFNSYSIRIFTKLSKSKASFEGWCGIHTCVTAAFAHLTHPCKEKVTNYLQHNQEPEGYWKAYWWTDNEYATALASEALFDNLNTNNRIFCKNAVRWAETANAFRSPFVAALIIRILLCNNTLNSQIISPILDYLLKAQLSDGSWEASAFLRIPPTYITKPDTYINWHENMGGGGSYQRDYGRLFTTATVLVAIETLLKRVLESEDL